MKALWRILIGIILLFLCVLMLATGYAGLGFFIFLISGIGFLLSGIAEWKKNGLIQKKWMTDAKETGKLNNEKKLKEVAMESTVAEVRLAAVNKLNAPDALTEIAQRAPYADTRAAAVVKITDQSVLCGIARNDAELSVKVAAIERITDSKALKELVSALPTLNNFFAKRVLQHAVNVAMEAPQLLTDLAPWASAAIRDSHQDFNQKIPGAHTDMWQEVPHVSSDCHSDDTPWTQQKGTYGMWGYHGDGTATAEERHVDTVPLSQFKQQFK